MKRIASLLFSLSLVAGLVACGGNDSQSDIDSQSDGEGIGEDAVTEAADLVGNGICDPGEKAISVTCDGKDIVTRHADPACSAEHTTYESVSCLKYEVVIAEANNFSFNQKGTCSDADGTPTCVLDTEYHCPDTATQKVKCSAGYQISYWNFASCGETVVELSDSCTDDTVTD